MTPDSSTSCLCFEYFCQQGDALWTMPDRQLVAKATEELARLGLAGSCAVVDAKIVRMPKAYPVYDGAYQRGLATVRAFLNAVPNLQLVGRNGIHHYNNQDHSMLTAVLAARNTMVASYNLWDLEIDSGYLEEGSGLNAAELQSARCRAAESSSRDVRRCLMAQQASKNPEVLRSEFQPHP